MRRAALVFASVLLAAAGPVRYALPADATPSELADKGSEVVVNNCSACHSLDYITTQPRSKGAKFWRDAVDKMIKVYGAPVSPGDADAVAARLSAKFG